MSLLKVRQALEVALRDMVPQVACHWENAKAPTVSEDEPFQRAEMLFAQPDNSEYGPNFLQEGYLQVTLCYPMSKGSAAAMSRAELLRATFPRGASFVSGQVVTNITRTPEVMTAYVDGGRYCVPVRIRFMAQITVGA